MNEEIENQLAAILGGKFLVQTDNGLYIWQIEPHMTPFLSVSKAPKKLTAQWIIEKAAKVEAARSAAKVKREETVNNLKKELSAKGVTGFHIYLTSFGFSVCNLFHDGLKAAKEVIESCSIDYKKMEYSEAHWVVRVYV